MRFRLQIIWQSRSFWTVVGLFLFANLWTVIAHPECCDRYDGIGFPLPFHLSGGIAGIAEFYPISLALNVLSVLTIAVIAARIGVFFDNRD